MYSIKDIPEDFIVIEEQEHARYDDGQHQLFIMKKRNYTTHRAVSVLANALKISAKQIGFAGNKDRRAVTLQYVSARISRKIGTIRQKDLTAIPKGRCRKPLSLGDLEGNRFAITVRNLDNENYNLPKKVLNLYDSQRFSKNNADIGKAIIKKEFKEAASLLINSAGEAESAARAHLHAYPNDYIGALRSIPKLILKMYVHAYQSLLFNRAAVLIASDRKPEQCDVQIPGFGTEFNNSKESTAMKKVMEEEGLAPREFIIRQIPELSMDGTTRKLFMEIKDLEIGPVAPDDLHQGKLKRIVRFGLGKGSYATILIRHLFS